MTENYTGQLLCTPSGWFGMAVEYLPEMTGAYVRLDAVSGPGYMIDWYLDSQGRPAGKSQNGAFSACATAEWVKYYRSHGRSYGAAGRATFGDL